MINSDVLERFIISYNASLNVNPINRLEFCKLYITQLPVFHYQLWLMFGINRSVIISHRF